MLFVSCLASMFLPTVYAAVVWFTDVPVAGSLIVPAVAGIPAVAGTVAGVLAVAGVPAVDGVPVIAYIHAVFLLAFMLSLAFTSSKIKHLFLRRSFFG
jgi:hypothetical protein